MLGQVKQRIIQQLWHNYAADLPVVSSIQSALKAHYNEVLPWDHFALIDLPGPHTGIGTLSRLFFLLDYEICGSDYLAEKQNDFVWLAEKSIATQDVKNALPQIVLADFRRDALVPEVQKIIDVYAEQAKPLALEQLSYLKKRVLEQDESAADDLVNLFMHYLKGRDWPLPSVKEFETVRNRNELLSWVLVMGRQVNHFAWAIHLCKKFADLPAFNQFVTETLHISLNEKGGIIKGHAQQGITQSSSAATIKPTRLADGWIDLSDRFIEFVWRYPVLPNERTRLWKDYFSGFVANNADRVVESLYLD